MSLGDEKLEEEIKLIKIQHLDTQWRYWLDLAKLVGLFIGALVVFWLIQSPETEEKIKSERTKLCIEALKIPNDELRAMALKRVRIVHGVATTEQAQQFERSVECIAVARADYPKLLEMEKIIKLELELEISGNGGGGMAGWGPIAELKRQRLLAVKERIKLLEEQMRYCGLDAEISDDPKIPPFERDKLFKSPLEDKKTMI